ncbi:MAG TPA: DUF3592 domain-containing protein [Bryobacteraceae bacterium]|jgi:hypothetical protein|nr:DUF3592 domain-containing protein [Bryobacteraceae bacterium]
MDRYQEMAELQRTWTPPPELIGYGSREVQLSRQGIAVAVLAGILILGGVAAGIILERVGIQQSDEQSLLREQGKDADATVTKLWRANDKERRPMVAYQFEVEGRMCRRSVSVPLRVWRSLAVGAPLAVHYVPSNPARNHPSDWEESTMPLWVPLLVGAMLAGIGAVLVLVLRRQLALLSEGRPAPAVITRYSSTEDGQKNVHYEFPLMGGGLAKGKSGPKSKRRLPAIGATICVIYDRENPRRNAPYPLEMARLAKAATKVSQRGGPRRTRA